MSVFFSLFQKKLRKPQSRPIYFPWAFKIPTTTITPHTAPTIKEPELIAKAYIVTAAPDKPPIICRLGTKDSFYVGAGQISPGFGRSFATAGNTGASSVTPKIPENNKKT